MKAPILAAAIVLTLISAHAGEATRLAVGLAGTVNASSEHVRCVAWSEARSIVCVTEGGDGDDAAGRLAACLADVIDGTRMACERDGRSS